MHQSLTAIHKVQQPFALSSTNKQFSAGFFRFYSSPKQPSETLHEAISENRHLPGNLADLQLTILKVLVNAVNSKE